MIYPINEQIEELLDSFVDPTTGELKKYLLNQDGEPYEVTPEQAAELEAPAEDGTITIPPYLDTEELMANAIDKLQMEFDDKIVDLRNSFINLTAEAEALKREKLKLAERQKSAEAKAERTKRFLAYLLHGDKFQKGAVKISYRRSEEVSVDDDFVEWAAIYAPGLLKFSAPEPRKADIKNALKAGKQIEHVVLVQRNNIQVK